MSDYLSMLQNRLAEDLNVINITVIGVLGVFMCWLFLIDLTSYSGEHKDFKSILVSTGILGTFIGIFIGLWNFDSGDIENSVPQLLGGLKTAFITSILGMLLAILLSVFQKFKRENIAEDEITALNGISTQLKKLEKLESISKHTETLPLIKEELTTNQQALLRLLAVKLNTIDNSLKEAVKTLAQGATAEIIKALENVIQDFNQNLTEQFGDNFSQLNEAVLNMIEWQKTYRDSVQDFEKQLKQTAETTEMSHKNITNLVGKFISENNNALLKTADITAKNSEQIRNITDNYAQIAEISTTLETVITTNQNQIENLERHLESLAKIGKDAGGITTELANFSNEIQGSLTNQAETLTQLTAEIENQLPATLGTLNESLTSLTKQFASDYENFLKQVSRLMQANNNN